MFTEYSKSLLRAITFYSCDEKQIFYTTTNI